MNDNKAGFALSVNAKTADKDQSIERTDPMKKNVSNLSGQAETWLLTELIRAEEEFGEGEGIDEFAKVYNLGK